MPPSVRKATSSFTGETRNIAQSEAIAGPLRKAQFLPGMATARRSPSAVQSAYVTFSASGRGVPPIAGTRASVPGVL